MQPYYVASPYRRRTSPYISAYWNTLHGPEGMFVRIDGFCFYFPYE